MHDDRLEDDVRRAFGRGYSPPEPGLEDRAFAGVSGRSGDSRRAPVERWLPAVAAVVLAVVV